MTNQQLQNNYISELKTIQPDDHKHFFYTYDLGCAASLICAGFQLVSLNSQNPKKVQFIFKREIGIDEVIDSFWADRLQVSAQSFFNATKRLKNQIYSSK